jgi:hypothetical protein
MRPTTCACATLGALLAITAGPARGGEVPQEYRASVEKGLKWLAEQQHKDGHWEADGGQYPVAMTALAGMALLGEGSTVREGRYKDNILRATKWLMKEAYWDNNGVPRNEPNGLLANPEKPGDAGRYMFGHGFALLFLSCVYAEEEDTARRKELEKILVAACKFSRKAQTSRGGWGYVSARDGNDFDEGCVTVVQVQALWAARHAGITVPPEALRDARKYHRNATGTDGGVMYSLVVGGGPGRPAHTAGAAACARVTDAGDAELVSKWLLFCRDRLPANRPGFDDYAHFYYAQAVYRLGDDGWKKLFPDDKGEAVTWSQYRKARFDVLVRAQAADGSWNDKGIPIGPVYATAANLAVLQLDRDVLPVYAR